MRRLLIETDDAFELALLRSAKADAAPNGTAEKAAIALGAVVTLGAASTVAAAATASSTAKSAATAGKLGAIAIWKWIGLGVIVGSAVTMGTEHAVRHGESSLAGVAAVAPAAAGGSSTAENRQASKREGEGEGAMPVPSPATEIPEVAATAPIPFAVLPAPIRPARNEAPPPSAAAISAEIAAISAPPVVAPSASAVPMPAPNASALAVEVASLDRARRALAAKDPAEAIRLLDVYEREVPVRVLGPEAQVLRIEAVAARGDRAEAKRLGEQFLLVYPRDPHADRVRRLLQTMSNL